MNSLKSILLLSLIFTGSGWTQAQTNPIWHQQKIKNFLPHMTRPEVEDLLKRTDMVIFPIAAMEQHGLHLPMGTDYLNGVEKAKLIAQRTDVLVAPILMPGNSPYHMGFAGTITLSLDTIQRVFFEAAQSLMRHGFKRFLIYTAHAGNRNVARYIIDRINHETEGIAVELGEAAAPFRQRSQRPRSPVFDRHGGVGETSSSLFLTPNLVDMNSAETATLTFPDHMKKMLPAMIAGDPTVSTVFLAEGLKAEETGKKTSAREMSSTGVWGVRDLKEASADQGRDDTQRFVNAAVQFIERWKELRPVDTEPRL
jgi:creatinine amidohydrolase